MKTINNIANNVNISLDKASAFGWKNGKLGFAWVAEKATQASRFCEQRESKARERAKTIEEKLAQKEGATVFDVFDTVSEEYSEDEPIDDTLDIEAHLDDDCDEDEDPSVVEILESQYENLQVLYKQYMAGERSQAKREIIAVYIHAFANLFPSSLQGFSPEEIKKITMMAEEAGHMMKDIMG